VKLGVLRPLLLLSLAALLAAHVTDDQLLHADREPQNCLTYSGGYSSQRYSGLTGLTRANVGNLEVKWVYHAKYPDKMEAPPLVVNGVLYTVQDSSTFLSGQLRRPLG
jgi:alcohol dehydrogenase (cytochrome c)